MDIPSGLILGIAYVAAPGPILVETLRQGVKGGFIGSLAVQAGSSIGVIAYAMLALFGAGLLLQDGTWQFIAGASGMTVLVYLGVMTIRDGRDLVLITDIRAAGKASPRRAFGTGALLSLANPLDIIFWLSIGSRLLYKPGPAAPAFLGGFFGGCILTAVIAALLASAWQSRLTPQAARTIAWICGLALIGFGLRLGLSLGEQLKINW